MIAIKDEELAAARARLDAHAPEAAEYFADLERRLVERLKTHMCPLAHKDPVHAADRVITTLHDVSRYLPLQGVQDKELGREYERLLESHRGLQTKSKGLLPDEHVEGVPPRIGCGAVVGCVPG